MKQERLTRLVARFTATADDGTEYVIEEFGDFLRVQDLSGQWSQPMRSGGRLKCGPLPVNPTADPDVFEVLKRDPVLVRRKT